MRYRIYTPFTELDLDLNYLSVNDSGVLIYLKEGQKNFTYMAPGSWEWCKSLEGEDADS